MPDDVNIASVDSDSYRDEREVLAKDKALKFMLWIAMVSISMLFAGLTSGYIVRRQTGTWLKFELPFTFWISTSIILLSSITMNWAVQSIRDKAKNEELRTKSLQRAVIVTLILGLAFGLFQFLSWKALVNE